jgi:hypothetical protein
MQFDFSIRVFSKLLDALDAANYSFQPFADFILNPQEKVVILRHDIDRKPGNALVFAEIQNKKRIKGTYYFRFSKKSFVKEIVEKIIRLGHEIGYHYEDLVSAKGVYEAAIHSFVTHLESMREFYPVQTICMHGSPFSKYDNSDLWHKYDYKKFGIIGEPYFDIDFNKVMYLTDTGRRWDGERVNIRDKVRGEGENRGQKGEESRGAAGDLPAFHLHSTRDIIKALKENLLPDQIMLTVHPQRWNNNALPWTIELITQNIKNTVKRIMVLKNK